MMCGTYMAFGALLIANCCQRTRQQQAARLTSSIRRFQTPIANPRGLLAPQPPPLTLTPLQHRICTHIITQPPRAAAARARP